MQIKNISLIVPDLFDPIPFLKQIPNSELPELSAFSTILSRGKFSNSIPFDNFYSCLFNTLGTSSSNNSDPLAIASISYLADKPAPISNKWIMRADPCFMAPDRDQLILAENKLDITLQEAKILVDEINQFFKQFDEEKFWSLELGSPDRWYIISDKPLNIECSAPEKVLMQSVKAFLLQGKDSPHWINLFNEFQMILHKSAVNKKRLKQGKLAINSVWFWGAGESIDSLPESQNNKPNHCVYSHNIIVKGLCEQNHYEYRYLTENYQADDGFQNVTYITENFSQALQQRDIFSWVGLLQQYEENYLIPIIKDLKSGKINEVKFISPGGKNLLITKKLINRWWKRIKPYYIHLTA